MSGPSRRTVTQNAWVVSDIEQAARAWSRALGIGPFFLGTYPASLFEGMQYRGGAGELTMRTAIAYSGDLQIELIEPLGDSPNAYRDMYPAGRTGFHHVCFWSDDLDADLAHYARQGQPTVNVGQMRGGPRFAYVDTRAAFGCMTELLEPHPHVIELFDGWRRQSHSWDGRAPIVFL
ncbi:MAG: VOC family protein [Pseudomonadota bacterium]